MTVRSVRIGMKPSDSTVVLASETGRMAYVISHRFGRKTVRPELLQKQECVTC